MNENRKQRRRDDEFSCEAKQIHLLQNTHGNGKCLIYALLSLSLSLPPRQRIQNTWHIIPRKLRSMYVASMCICVKCINVTLAVQLVSVGFAGRSLFARSEVLIKYEAKVRRLWPDNRNNEYALMKQTGTDRVAEVHLAIHRGPNQLQ